MCPKAATFFSCLPPRVARGRSCATAACPGDSGEDDLIPVELADVLVDVLADVLASVLADVLADVLAGALAGVLYADVLVGNPELSSAGGGLASSGASMYMASRMSDGNSAQEFSYPNMTFQEQGKRTLTRLGRLVA